MMPMPSGPASDAAVPAADGARPESLDEVVGARLAAVRRRIAEAAARVDRSPHAVTLVAVSKLIGLDAILAARRAGQSDFGESRAQELRRKSREAGPGVRWHFVGRLQRNKVRDVVGVASLIHSVDRLELASAIAEHAAAQGRVQRVLVQVNVGEDPAKGGCAVEETAGLVARVRGSTASPARAS
jgi:PLP dependent protein